MYSLIDLPNDMMSLLYKYLNKLDLIMLLYTNKRCKKYSKRCFFGNNYEYQSFNIIAKYQIMYELCPTQYLIVDAAYFGYLDIMKWAITKFEKNSSRKTKTCKEQITYDAQVRHRNKYACSVAAINGHLHVLKWCRLNQFEWTAKVCSNAAINGHLETLIWAKENGCDWDNEVCSNAALNGHFEILKWVNEVTRGANQLQREKCCNWIEVCSNAAINGHLEIIEWVNEVTRNARVNEVTNNAWVDDVTRKSKRNNCDQNWSENTIRNICCWSEDACSNAAIKGHLNILMWIRENGGIWNNDMYVNAATYGHLHIFEWIFNNNYETSLIFSSNIWEHAAINGHLEILKWAKNNGHDWCWKFNVCLIAAENNHLEMLKWGKDNGNEYNWNSDICKAAAKNGHLNILAWARENGCDWDSDVCLCAAKFGHLNILKWAVTNGCDWNIEKCKSIAKARSQIRTWIDFNIFMSENKNTTVYDWNELKSINLSF